MVKKLTDEELSLLANFVFKGTVQRLKSASMSEVPVTARTAVVRVDEIVEAPDSMTDFAGREITVEMGGKKSIKKGDQAIFYANGWVFGEGLAVRSIDQRPAVGLGMAVMGVTPGDPVENLHNKQARARFDTSSVVISGRVKSVRVPSAQIANLGAIGAAAAETTPAEVKPISEHDPVMQEAIVEVDAVHKGGSVGSETTVLFPSSTDVQWFKAPKFRPGQQGFFMLHKEKQKEVLPGVTGAIGAMVSAEVAEELPSDTFTALHPADFQPLDQPGGVRNLITDLPTPAVATED